MRKEPGRNRGGGGVGPGAGLGERPLNQNGIGDIMAGRGTRAKEPVMLVLGISNRILLCHW